MKKGNNSFYWRKKIQNERRSSKARFKGRIRSKGETKANSRLSSSLKGQKWVSKIKAEKNIANRAQMKKASTFRMQRNRVKPYRSFQKKQGPSLNSTDLRKATPVKNRIVSSKFQSQPITTKREVNLLKKRQAVIKTPQPAKAIESKAAGIAKLKSAALRNQPVSPSIKMSKVPSKGAMLLKKSASKIGNQPRNVKRVKQPVIRKGR